MESYFGKVTREIRAKRGDSLRVMSKKIGISAAFLSMMEVGHKVIPSGYLERIDEVYHLTPEEYRDLQEGIALTNNSALILFDQLNEEQRDVSMVFARRIVNSDPDLVAKLKAVLAETDPAEPKQK